MKKTALLSVFVRALPVLAILALGSGCATDDIIDPIYEFPSNTSVIVIPFKDEDFQNGFDSPRGTALAQRVTKLLEQHGECKVVPIEKAMELYDTANPRDLTSQEICEKTGADYVVRGEVLVFRHRDPGAVNALRGTSSVGVTLFESAKAARQKAKDGDKVSDHALLKGRIVRTSEVSTVFPNEYGLTEEGVWEIGDHNAYWIEKGLMARTSTAVAELFYGHVKEESHLTQQ
jgi:hypothetical protein